jgi:homoserine trans-succinylase
MRNFNHYFLINKQKHFTNSYPKSLYINVLIIITNIPLLTIEFKNVSYYEQLAYLIFLNKKMLTTAISPNF